ncbi:MAG: ketoacyl-ACP synthase III [Acidimicrobiia bacterium]|nr:ketoacyl-ACP synthase III [Acidimicrobiia bacterium]
MAVRIAGIGTSLPAKVLSNQDLEATLDTSDAWIRERAGIVTRHVGGITSQLGIEAGNDAIKAANISADDIDLLLLSTSSPDQRFPGTSAQIHAGLGLNCGAFDVNAACAGFAYGYVAAYAMMMLAGGPKRVLNIGSDALSTLVDYDDRSTAILFGDGAGACVMERHEQGELLAFDLGADGDLAPILYCRHGGTIKMAGREVFKKAVRAVAGSIEATLKRAKLTPADVDVVLLHQANIRIIESVCTRTSLPMSKTFNVIETTGNTSTASIPLAMQHAANQGVLEPNKIVLMSGFGAGMTWATLVVRW